ncbi:MAG: DUF4349 domain-containing protein [Nitriliruptorales bacterium]|nr:DUF4349 domain-containing protein [Nitriliruptorales bacterium]
MLSRAAAAAVMVLFLGACGGGDAGTAEDAGTTEVAAGGSAAGGGDDGESADRAAVDEPIGLAEGAADDDVAQDEGNAPAAEPLPDTQPVNSGDRIIKEGTVSGEVEENEFDRAFARVVAAAGRYGGDVVGSSTRTDDDGDTLGSVTVRVPVEDFENLIVSVGEIGTIRHRDIGSQDVTAEFTDLESRLRHERAQERFYLGLLDQAKSVDDAIAVQQQLVGIQQRIERIQGRLNVLGDRTTFSTLTVELFEPGLGGVIAQEDDPQTRPSLAHYWDIARDAFVNVVGAIMVAVLFLLPVLIMMIAAGALWVVVRRRPEVAVRPAPPSPEPDEEPVGTAH